VISQFFIDRPVFAWVLAIVLMMAGALSVFRLPIQQYPSIAPPQVSINITYPGASAQTVQDAVVQVVEQQLNGIDNLDYLTSDSNADGSAQITLTFEQSTNPDVAQVQVQNKLQLAMPLLPQEVQQQGVRVAKPTRNFLVILGFISANDSMSSEDIGDYVATNVLDQLNRTPGVGDVQMFGSQYAMRVWLDPEKLNNFGLTSTDIAAAIRAQNAQVSAGQIGGLPAVSGQQMTAAIIGPTRLSTPDEFRQILVRVNPDGSQLRLGDVTRVSMNSENYVRDIKIDGKPAAGMAIRLAVGANALDTVTAIKATLQRLEPFFPPGLQPTFPLDSTPFVRASIEEVVFTLLEAIGLVFVVIFVFLQNLRATLIPTIAVPIVLLGTFGVLAAFGFSINTLTMFGVALSIGLLVDDAIVVVENVERLMVQEQLSPKDATRKSMRQITGALIGIALVLAAVFVPMAFFGGSAGVIYRQFSITMVSAMTLSVLTALILTPALCATMLKPMPAGGRHVRGGFFGWFNRAFGASARGYDASVAGGLRRPMRTLAVYAALVAVMAVLYARLPTSFFPDEDTGILYGQVQAPPGASQERTWKSLDAMQDYFLGKESDSIEQVLTVVGFNFAGTGQNSGLAFMKLKDWSQRTKASQSVNAVAARATRYFATIRDAMVLAFAPPAVMELGNATGFDMQLQNRGGLTHEAFLAARNQLLADAAKSPALVAVRPNGVEDAPQIKLEIDREKASALGVSIADINQTITAAWAPSYVNDFIDHGRVKRVYLQGEAYARMQPEDLTQWYVRNAKGGMVPLAAFATANWTYGAQKLSRFNGVPAYEILGAPAPGHSSGEAMNIMEDLVAKLPNGVGLEWTGLSFEEKLAGARAPILYALSLVVVFLCLAALYESWSIPVTVLLVVPIGVLGALLATWLRGLSNDVYFQVGLLTTIGLGAKNAVLIVEFAKASFDRGAGLKDAVTNAARLRFRPIVMTSLAFTFGVLPLAIATGAGSGAQNAVGTGVVGGMIASTLLGIVFVPVFFVVILKLFKVRPTKLGTPDPIAVPRAIDVP
jgi:multidrug efflux pump